MSISACTGLTGPHQRRQEMKLQQLDDKQVNSTAANSLARHETRVTNKRTAAPSSGFVYSFV